MKKKIKPKKQKEFFDEERRREEISRHIDPLQRLNSIISWEMFRHDLEKCFEKEAKGAGGRPAFDVVFMFKVLVLQQTYALSDAQVEFSIKDRMSFQNFLGITLADLVPDEKTVWHFRNQLSFKNMSEKLFALFGSHLKNQGLLLGKGKIVDASFIEVPKQRNTKEENKTIKEGNIPDEWAKEENAPMLAQKDTDARWTMKNKQTFYGYKDHVKVDAETKLIETFVVTSAEVHDSQKMEDLITKEDKGNILFGDSAYSGDPIAKKLEEFAIENKIHEKGTRNHPLSEKQKLRNREKSKIRSRVEHIFGFMENRFRGMNIRSIGIRRSKNIIGIMNLVYNFFRFEQIHRLNLCLMR